MFIIKLHMHHSTIRSSWLYYHEELGDRQFMICGVVTGISYLNSQNIH